MAVEMDYVNKGLAKKHGQGLREVVRAGDAEAIAAALDALDPEARIHAARFLNGRDQAQLWERCEGRRVELDDMVPPELPAGTVVRHFGRNSLPLFTLFEKRFQRADEGEALWGYNHQPLMGLTGPGYYVADIEAEWGGLSIDYRRVPPKPLNGGPPVLPNDSGLISKLVYKGMVDRMRKVSQHVTVGRVFKRGKWENNYFLLCREVSPKEPGA